MPESAQALAAWSLLLHYKRPVLGVGDGIHALESMHRCVLTLQPNAADSSPLWFPPWESQAGHGAVMNSEILGDRLRAASQLVSAEQPTLCLTAVQALMQRTFTKERLTASSRHISTGDSFAGWAMLI